MSIFTNEDGHAVMALPLDEAKQHCLRVIDAAEGPKPTTKKKAKILVQKQRSTTQLATAIYGWILAHPSEGLKVI